MRCLQCGKGIPLFKRLGGSSEFCSDAHRREYQREYSQLALGRLMQSHSSESRVVPVQAPPLATASAPTANEPPATAVNSGPAVNIAPSAAKPSATPAWAETARPATTPSVPAGNANGIAKSQPPPPIPVKKAVPLPAASQPATTQAAVSQPAVAKAAAVQKPAPAELQFALVAAPEFEHAFASLAPDRPRRQPDRLLASLPQSGAVEWESGVEIANSIARPAEHKLDLREVARTTPRIALDLRIVPPESLETESWPLTVPITLANPAEASLWIGPHRDIAGELAPLNDFANHQFSKSDFEAPVFSGGAPVIPETPAIDSEPPVISAASVVAEPSVIAEPPVAAEPSLVAEPLAPEPQPAAVASEPLREEAEPSVAESQTTAPIPTLRIPDPELNPLAVNSTGIAAGKAKPLPVFFAAPMSTGTIQIPQPNGLPLRPLMVLSAAAPASGVTTETKHRKGNFLGLHSVLSNKPALSAAPDLGRPEIPAQTPAGPMASRMRKILAALGGAAVLGVGIFFFLGKQSDARLKPPPAALSDGATGDQWIANFAPDAKRKRRVSLLRSSMNLSAYRLDFESSIRIKALGWVYRAQDPKNFYVSKIEFQKPGVNPVYALVHYAVINGVEQARVEAPLHVTVPMGGLYKIRFEAVGNRFATWVQGQRVEQWTDARLSSGGAGLYAEGAEQSVLHGDFRVTPLSN